MADTKISALASISEVTDGLSLVANEGGISKQVTVGQIFDWLGSLDLVGQQRLVRLKEDVSTSSTTGVEVTDLSTTLVAGTYVFEYFLLTVSLDGSGCGLGINYTGTATTLCFQRMAVTNGTTDVGVLGANITFLDGSLMGGWSSIVESTTSPSTVVASQLVDASNAVLEIIEGTIVVSNGGDLELWFSSATGGDTALLWKDSMLRITRMN